MSKMTRRTLLVGALFPATLGLVLQGGAAAQNDVGITVRSDGRICASEVRTRIEDAINDMISAAEKRAGKPLSEAEKEAWLKGGWSDARTIIRKHYAFFD